MAEENAAALPGSRGLMQRLTANGALGSIFSSAGLLGSRLGGVALTLAYTLLIARVMSQSDVGIVATLNSGMVFASALVTLNYEAGASRHLVQAMEAGRKYEVNGYLRVGRKLLLFSGPLVAVIHFFVMRAINPTIPMLALVMTSVAIPVIASLIYFGRLVSQLGLPIRSQFANLFVRPMLLFGLVTADVLIINQTSPTAIATCLLGSAVLSWLSQRLLLARNGVLPAIDGAGDHRKARTWIATGAFLSPRMVVEQYFPDAVIFASSAALTHSDVALLMITMRFVNILRFGIVSVEMALTPKLARAEARNDIRTRNSIIDIGGQMRFWPVLIACAVVMVLAPWVLSLFGKSYAHGADALRLSLITPLGMALFGPSYILLIVKGHVKTIGAVAILGLISLFILVPIASRFGGLLGSVGASSAIAFGMNAAFYATLRTRTGLDTSIFGSTARILKRKPWLGHAQG